MSYVSYDVSITVPLAVPRAKLFTLMAQEEISPREAAPVRKVVQISSMVHPEKDWAFIALCDDGSLWLYHGSWSRIQNMPQTTDL